MPEFTILYDEPQEAEWFRSLNPAFADASEDSMSNAQNHPDVKAALLYDRPDIILLDGGTPVLVVEETVEVPSGHNVGQRFARIAAAAENAIPCIYFGPYVAKKHGGATAGRRFMNVRLFHALDVIERTRGTAVVAINWPVDEHYEVRRDAEKDDEVREYVAAFLTAYQAKGRTGINEALLASAVHKRLIAKRDKFVQTRITNPGQYDGPPASVRILPRLSLVRLAGVRDQDLPEGMSEAVVYNVGMRYIRSDPYTGMAMLYKYLYVAEYPTRGLILWFPNISHGEWTRTADGRGAERKDIRLFRMAADAILFADAFILKNAL